MVPLFNDDTGEADSTVGKSVGWFLFEGRGASSRRKLEGTRHPWTRAEEVEVEADGRRQAAGFFAGLRQALSWSLEPSCREKEVWISQLTRRGSYVWCRVRLQLTTASTELEAQTVVCNRTFPSRVVVRNVRRKRRVLVCGCGLVALCVGVIASQSVTCSRQVAGPEPAQPPHQGTPGVQAPGQQRHR